MQRFYLISILSSVFISSHSFSSMKLESGEVCSLTRDPFSIKLHGADESAVVVLEENFFATWTGRYNFKCKFSVQAKDRVINDGIYAVIQNLEFRKNYTTGECIDYIEFSIPANDYTKLIGIDKMRAVRFCGRLNPSMAFSPFEAETIGPNAYVTKKGQLAVEIYIASQRLPPDESLHVSVAFTAYKNECYRDKKGLRQCRHGECIWGELFDDGIQNCPYRSCADETECYKIGSTLHDYEFEDPQRKHIDYGSHSRQGFGWTVGAIGTTVMVFLLFAGCLCLCKRSERCCFKAARHPPVVQMADRDQIALPSAPLEPVVKDAPPPSYDSIFGPERSGQVPDANCAEPMVDSRH